MLDKFIKYRFFEKKSIKKGTKKKFYLSIFLFFLSVIFELFPSLGYEKMYLTHEKVPDGTVYEIKNRGARGSITFQNDNVKYLSSCPYFLDPLCLNSKHGQKLIGKNVYILKTVGSNRIIKFILTEGEFSSDGKVLTISPVPNEHIKKYADSSTDIFKIKRLFSIISFSYLIIMSFIYFFSHESKP